MASPKGTVQQQGNQGQRQFERHHTLGSTPRIPIAPGPPQLEQYPPAIPVRVLLHPAVFSRVYTIILTAPLTVGGA